MRLHCNSKGKALLQARRNLCVLPSEGLSQSASIFSQESLLLVNRQSSIQVRLLESLKLYKFLKLALAQLQR